MVYWLLYNSYLVSSNPLYQKEKFKACDMVYLDDIAVLF